MIMSQVDAHTHLWYHVPHCSIENVLQLATKVSTVPACYCIAENDLRYWLSRSLATNEPQQITTVWGSLMLTSRIFCNTVSRMQGIGLFLRVDIFIARLLHIDIRGLGIAE